MNKGVNQMKFKWYLGATCAALLASAVPSQADTAVSVGLSGWTGFAPLTLAKEAGIFKKNGLDVTLTKIPQASRLPVWRRPSQLARQGN